MIGEKSLSGYKKESKRDPKWFVKKRTKSGIYITIAEGNTRKDIIDKLKADSETYYQKREVKDGKEIH
jgi:hypothetical protein